NNYSNIICKTKLGRVTITDLLFFKRTKEKRYLFHILMNRYLYCFYRKSYSCSFKIYTFHFPTPRIQPLRFKIKFWPHFFSRFLSSLGGKGLSGSFWAFNKSLLQKIG